MPRNMQTTRANMHANYKSNIGQLLKILQQDQKDTYWYYIL